MAFLQSFPQVFLFLSPGWETTKGNAVVQAVSAVSHDIQRSVKTVSTAVNAVPAQIVKNVDTMMDGVLRVFTSKELAEHPDLRPGTATDETDGTDNIPLRITLRLLDEVFDLADRNIWLRRQMITVLRQIVKTMFGDTVNKRIVDYVASLTAAEAVSGYLNNIKETLWPGGFPAAAGPERDEATRLRSRVAARASLASSLSDELRRVIGSETSRAGLGTLFDMLQHPTTNKRLVIVIIESALQVVFPEHQFGPVLRKLHSRSSRIRDDLKNSQRTPADLRRH